MRLFLSRLFVFILTQFFVLQPLSVQAQSQSRKIPQDSSKKAGYPDPDWMKRQAGGDKNQIKKIDTEYPDPDWLKVDKSKASQAILSGQGSGAERGRETELKVVDIDREPEKPEIPSQALLDAVDFFIERFNKSGSAWDYLRSSNTLLEIIASDEVLSAEEKKDGITSLSTVETWKSQMGDKEAALELLDAVLANASVESINKVAWFIVKEGNIKAKLSGNASGFEKDFEKLDVPSPLDPIYLAQVSQKYMEEYKQKLIEDKMNQNPLSKFGKGDHAKLESSGSWGNAGDQALANAKSKKSNMDRIMDCVDGYMNTGPGGGTAGPAGPNGGAGNPLGTTTPDGGPMGGQGGSIPGPHGPDYSGPGQVGGGGGGYHQIGSGECYGANMADLQGMISNNKMPKKFEDQKNYFANSIHTQPAAYSWQTRGEDLINGKNHNDVPQKAEVYTTFQPTGVTTSDVIGTNPDTKKGEVVGQVVTSIQGTLTTQTVVNGKVVSNDVQNVSVTPSENKNNYNSSKEGAEVTSPLHNTNGAPSGNTNPSPTKNSGDEVGGDQPCDGEREHMAFASCIGTPSSGGGTGIGGGDGGLPSCSEYFGENGRPSPVAEAVLSASGGNSSCSGEGISGTISQYAANLDGTLSSACGDDQKPQCRGDSYALILFALNPNLPLWDPLHMEAQQAGKKKETTGNPQLNLKTQKLQGQTQATSSSGSNKKSHVSNNSNQAQGQGQGQAGSSGSSKKVPLKPLGGGQPSGGGSGSGGGKPAPKPGK